MKSQEKKYRLEIAKRLKSVMANHSLSQKDVADKTGVSQASISRYVGAQRSPDSFFLTRFADAYQLELNWLLTGQSPPRQADEPPEIVFSPLKLKGIDENPAMLRLVDASGNYAAVPLLRDAVAAGAPTEVAERDVENWAIIYKDRKWLPRGPENYTCVRVRGRSMFPVLNDGDIVAIDHSERPSEIRELKRLNGKIVAFKIDGGVTIKWLKFDEKTETVVGVPENKEELDHLVILRGKEINEGIVGLVRWWWSKR